MKKERGAGEKESEEWKRVRREKIERSERERERKREGERKRCVSEKREGGVRVKGVRECGE